MERNLPYLFYARPGQAHEGFYLIGIQSGQHSHILSRHVCRVLTAAFKDLPGGIRIDVLAEAPGPNAYVPRQPADVPLSQGRHPAN